VPNTRTAHVVACVFVSFVLVGLRPLPAFASAPEKVREEGRTLIRAGLYDEAVSTYAPWGRDMELALRSEIYAAGNRRDKKEELRLCRVYLDYYPFGQLDTGLEHWRKIASKYVDLLIELEKDGADERVSQNIAAATAYEKLWQYRLKYDRTRGAELADEIIERYPSSAFCPTAVFVVGDMFDSRDVIPLYEGYLERMSEAGAPRRSRVLVMMQYAQHCAYQDQDKDLLRKALATYQAIATLTDISYERRHSLLETAQIALRIGDDESIELSRGLFSQFLAAYPDAREAGKARMGLIQPSLAAGLVDEALRTLRDLERDAPKGTDIGAELFAVSKAYFGKKDYDRSLVLLKEIVERSPEGPSAPLAYIGMGEAYGKLGKEELMVEAYVKAASLPSADTRTDIMDASNTRNRAFEFLADYYMKKGNWAEAERWWQAWKPSSWCGTCADSMRQLKAKNIERCRIPLWWARIVHFSVLAFIAGTMLYAIGRRNLRRS